jgi:tetratricopeptide (TPR) repeat protein
MLKGDSGQRLLWSGSLPIGSKVDPEGLQENIGRFSCNLAVEVYYAETARIRALAPEDLGAAELTHLARQAVGQVSPGSAEIDRSLIERAMALGPTTAELVILDNFGKVIAVMSLESGECFASDMRTWASNAISADPTDWRGPLLASYVELWAGNFEAALAHGRNAHALCPYNPVIIGHLGATYVAMNEPEKALPELDFALSLSRFERQPYAILCNLALANLLLGRFEQALSLCEQASSCIPEFGLAYVLKIEALVAMGRTAEAARTYLDEVLGVHDSMIARLREHRVMPSFHIPAAEKALAAAVAAVAAVEDLDGADRLSPAANGRAFG